MKSFVANSEQITNLKNATINRLVEYSVSSIALESGYQKAHQFSLEILTDVCCDYLKKMTSLLRLACESEDSRDTGNDFVDSLERVFHQMNIPSAAILHQYTCRIDAIRKHKAKQQITSASQYQETSDKPI